MNIYNKFINLDIDTSLIGLEKGDKEGGYFCTPKGAKVIGWEGCDGIHYCFITGFDDAVFAVNPSSCADIYVYPLAYTFKDFLRLILALKSTTSVEQIILWDKRQFEEYMISSDNVILPEQQEVLNKIQNEHGLCAMENPFEYVKGVQENFAYDSLIFTDEYYDVLGLQKL